MRLMRIDFPEDWRLTRIILETGIDIYESFFKRKSTLAL